LLAIWEQPGLANVTPFADDRLRHGVEFILSRQNADGGFGTYERRRAGKLLELINPSEMFGQCMTELSYIECTASSLAALAEYRRHYPDLPGGGIDRAIPRAIGLLRQSQLPDGSWPGFWGINYTYAIFHVAKGFRQAGISSDDAALVRAADWLKEKQRADGGWSEHYTSCLEGRFIEHPDTQVVMTSWALLALLEILPPDDPAIRRGILWLLSKQQPDGAWPRQGVNGVFFGAAMLDYRLYHTYFPVWALARYTNTLARLRC
jgi:squalene/oxidosqualene cyclase-like protein